MAFSVAPTTRIGQADDSAFQPVRLGGIAVPVGIDARAHLLQQRDVEIYGALADMIAADNRNARHACPVQKRGDQQHGQAIDAGIALSDGGRGDVGGLDVHRPGFVAGHGCADFRQHAEREVDLGNVRHVQQAAGLGGQEGSDKLLAHGILGRLGADRPGQRPAAANAIGSGTGFEHESSPHPESRRNSGRSPRPARRFAARL